MHGRKIFWILVLLEASIIVINGAITPVSLGDESHHFRFAQNIYNTGKRAPFDPLYESGNPPGFFNNDPPLWHFGLAFLWKLTGGTSQTVAQIYHILFFILLVWITSLLAKEFTGKDEGGWFSALIIATVPMVVSFSTLLYMDVPMTALATLSFYFILKKRYIAAGGFSGLAYLTKLSYGFLFPSFLLVIFWNERGKILGLLKNVTLFTLPILMIYLPDSYWRKINISSRLDITEWFSVSSRLSSRLSSVLSSPLSLDFPTLRWKEYLNSYSANPLDWLKYLGFVFLFLLLLYLLRFRRWDRRSAILLVPVISYLLCFFLIFGSDSDIRYLIPILPFVVVLFIPNILSLRASWRFILIGICVLQFLGTSYYVHTKRQVSLEIKEAFEYIRNNVPKDALILYPEENLLIYGQRRVIWSAFKIFKSGPSVGLGTVFWGRTSEQMNHSLRINEVSHILIKKSRIYDDGGMVHFGGYPQSFVEKLPHLDGWVKMFENPGVELWKNTLTID